MRLTFSGSIKTLLAILAIGGAGAYFSGHGLSRLLDSGEEYSARERVRRMLEGVRRGTDIQAAVCLWSTGTVVASEGPLDVAEDRFAAWRAEKNLVTVSAFEILDSRLETTGPHMNGTGIVLVTARINGQEHVMRVAPGEPVRWVR